MLPHSTYFLLPSLSSSLTSFAFPQFTFSPFTVFTSFTHLFPALISLSLPPSLSSSSQTFTSLLSFTLFLLPLVVAEARVKVHTKGRVQHGGNVDIDGDYFFFNAGSAVGLIKILEPMNPLLNYYEYLIVSRGQEAFIAIGVCT